MALQLISGELVRLSVEEPEVTAQRFVSWSRDSEFRLLLDSGTPYMYSIKKAKEWIEKDIGKEWRNYYSFMIRTLSDDRLVGEIGLFINSWSSREAFVGIGIGERSDWGKGFGTDAMKVILRFAFCELNLRRVALDVFEYNPRAIRSYEKAGFTHEGRMRKYLNRDGRRWDILYMGILREEWLRQG